MVNFLDDDKNKSSQMGDNTNSAFVEPKRDGNWQKECGILCEKCNKIYTKQFTYYRHYSEKHPGCKINFTCTLCRFRSDDYNKFRNHCYRHVIEGRYKCHLCTKTYSQLSQLNSHISISHGNPLSCKICSKVYQSTSNLNRHIESSHTTNPRYSCEECGKILQSTTSLRLHMLNHKLGKYLMCDICGMKFSQKINLKLHKESHSNDNPFPCKFCPKTFVTKAKLVDHLVAHSDDRQFVCKICNKAYKTQRYLNDHQKQHAEITSLCCHVCGKGFSNSMKLKDHMNVHTGEKPYDCKYCEKAFTNFPNWLKHVRRLHKVDHKTGQPLTSAGLCYAKAKKITKARFNNNDIDMAATEIYTPFDTDLDGICVDFDFMHNTQIDDESLNNILHNQSKNEDDKELHTILDQCEAESFSPLNVVTETNELPSSIYHKASTDVSDSIYRNALTNAFSKSAIQQITETNADSVYRSSSSDGEFVCEGRHFLESSVAKELIEQELALSDNYAKDQIDSFDMAPDMPDVNVPSLINSLDDDLLYSNEVKPSELGFRSPMPLSATSVTSSTPQMPFIESYELKILSSDLNVSDDNNLRGYMMNFADDLAAVGDFTTSRVDSASTTLVDSASTIAMPNCLIDSLGNIYYVK